IIDLSDAELISLGFMGENVSLGLKSMVETVRADPENLGTVTCFMIDCVKRNVLPRDATRLCTSPVSSTYPIARETDYTLQSEPSNNSDIYTAVAPNLISKHEMTFWYHGISSDPPKLMWRSDYATNSFRGTPPPGARFFKLPTKTAHGVFNTPLNAVWDDVAPRILASMKAHDVKYSALKTVRFSTLEDGKDEETLGPVVVWIAVRPNTANAAAVRDATPDILRILADVQITDVVVEWYEASVTRLGGPPLMSVEDPTSPNFGLNHSLNAGLEIPIARQSDGAQGTVTLLFKEVRTSGGAPSERILALTNKHVASVDTTTDYEFDGDNPQHIVVCSNHRVSRAVIEIEDAIVAGTRNVIRLARQVKDLKSELGSRKHKRALRDLNEQIEDNTTLQTFLAEVSAEWQDPNGRRFGVIDWAPKISVGVDDHHYTRDIATLVVDGEKLENFEGNIIDLGNQYKAIQLEDLFWPDAAVRADRTIPYNLQLPIRRAPTRWDDDPPYIVGKHSDTTRLTL
ncbi:hypothetical protein C2E23DRAFT_713660, partial [Lenzites betulinus]